MPTSPKSKNQNCFDPTRKKLQVYLEHENTWQEHLDSIKDLRYKKRLQLMGEWYAKADRLREEAHAEFNSVSQAKVDPKRRGDTFFIARVVGMGPLRKKFKRSD